VTAIPPSPPSAACGGNAHRLNLSRPSRRVRSLRRRQRGSVELSLAGCRRRNPLTRPIRLTMPGRAGALSNERPYPTRRLSSWRISTARRWPPNSRARALRSWKQANIAQGPQQVNNQIGSEAAPRAHAEISANRSNELLGVSDGERLESRAARAASGAHPELEAVGVLHGAEDRRGEGNERAELR
jgi:hypothetical protein